jgi:hypothetical protein
MHEPGPVTIEQALFERMGVSVEDALATATDVLDEKVRTAALHGQDVPAQIDRIAGLAAQLFQPAVLDALEQLVDRLPQLVALAGKLEEVPGVFAAIADTFDEYQLRSAGRGIDLESAMQTILETALRAGTALGDDSEMPQRLGTFGLLKALRNPDVQRTLAYAVRFAARFGQKLEKHP